MSGGTHYCVIAWHVGLATCAIGTCTILCLFTGKNYHIRTICSLLHTTRSVVSKQRTFAPDKTRLKKSFDFWLSLNSYFGANCQSNTNITETVAIVQSVCVFAGSSGAAWGEGREASPLWVDVQKLCNMCAFIVVELLRITRQIHCKAVEQRATLIHRQYGNGLPSPGSAIPRLAKSVLVDVDMASSGRRSSPGSPNSPWVRRIFSSDPGSHYCATFRPIMQFFFSS